MVQQLHWSHWEVDNLHTCPKQEGEDFNFSSKKEPILKVVDQLSTPAFHNTSSNKKVSKAAWRENFFIFFHVFIFTSAVFIWFCTTISCCNSHVLVFNRGNKKVMTTSWLFCWLFSKNETFRQMRKKLQFWFFFLFFLLFLFLSRIEWLFPSVLSNQCFSAPKGTLTFKDRFDGTQILCSNESLFNVGNPNKR